jgi:hypothetical protein
VNFQHTKEILAVVGNNDIPSLAYFLILNFGFAAIFGGGGLIALLVYSKPAKGPPVRGSGNLLSPYENAVINIAAARTMVGFGATFFVLAACGLILGSFSHPPDNIGSILVGISLMLAGILGIILIAITVILFIRLRRTLPDSFSTPIELPRNPRDA